MDDLDEAVALVYAQPPSGFVAARAALVKQLKADKRKDDAARVAALRRPTKLAWAIGDAVRRAPEPAGAFFAALEGLAEPGADLRRRTAELRKAVSGLVEAADGVDPGEATAGLLATAADPDAATALRLGRLAEVPAGGGFGGLTLAPETAPAPAEAQETVAPPAPAEPRETVAPPAAGDAAPGAGTEDPDRERQARHDEEEAARQRSQRLDALRIQRDEAAAAEAEAARRVEAARASVEEAQAELERATAALEVARRAASLAATALPEAGG